MHANISAGYKPPHPPTDDTHDSSFALLVYPAECNLTGSVYPLSWAARAKLQGLPNIHPSRIITVVDTAKILSTTPFSLDENPHIDALVFSAYKLCARHTGVGALLVRKNSLLEQLLLSTASTSYFAGGRSAHALTPYSDAMFIPASRLEDALQLGTPNLYALCTLPEALSYFEPAVLRCVREDAEHVAEVFRVGIEEAFPGVEIYSDEHALEHKSSVVAFGLVREGGEQVGHTEVGRVLEVAGVFARVGCMCNAGACAESVGMTDNDVIRNVRMGVRCGVGGDFVNGKRTGVVRVSFGWGSLIEDAMALVRILQTGIGWKLEGQLLPNKTWSGLVIELWQYAVRGMGGRRVPKVAIENARVRGDRQFGVFCGDELVSVRDIPELVDFGAGYDEQGELEVWKRGAEEVVHKEDIDSWLSEQLGRLVWISEIESKKLDVLVVWEGQVAAVAREAKLSRDEVIRAVRPNIVVSGDRNGCMGDLLGENLKLEWTRNCGRCGVVNVIGGEGVLKAIVRVARRAGRGGVVFGALYKVEDEGGGIAVGSWLHGEPSE